MVKDEIVQWLKNHRISNYEIQDDCTVNVFTMVDISNHELNHIPFVFGKIEGSFYCSDNKLNDLSFLKDIEIDGDIIASRNNIKTLMNGPKKVWGKLDLTENRLRNLQGNLLLVEDLILKNNVISNYEDCLIEITNCLDISGYNLSPQLIELININAQYFMLDDKKVTQLNYELCEEKETIYYRDYKATFSNKKISKQQLHQLHYLYLQKNLPKKSNVKKTKI